MYITGLGILVETFLSETEYILNVCFGLSRGIYSKCRPNDTTIANGIEIENSFQLRCPSL